MGLLARAKNKPGGSRSISTVTATSTVFIPDDQSAFYISGSSAITLIKTPTIIPGREVTFIGADEGSARDFVNSSATTIPYGMMLGSASEITIGDNDMLRIMQLQNGAWLRIRSTDN